MYRRMHHHWACRRCPGRVHLHNTRYRRIADRRVHSRFRRIFRPTCTTCCRIARRRARSCCYCIFRLWHSMYHRTAHPYRYSCYCDKTGSDNTSRNRTIRRSACIDRCGISRWIDIVCRRTAGLRCNCPPDMHFQTPNRHRRIHPNNLQQRSKPKRYRLKAQILC